MALVTPETVLQAVRSWLKVECAATPLTNAQVVASDAKGQRPALPYLTVKILAPDTIVGSDEDIREVSAGIPTFRARGQRQCTASIQGFGALSATWLTRCAARLRHPAAMTTIDALGLTIEPLGGMQDLAALVDTSIEGRFLREFQVSYAQLTDIDAQVEAVNVVVDGVLESEQSSDLPILVEA